MSDYAPRRVVSLQPSATVILRDMGKLDCLVACTKYCAEVCPEVRGKTAIVADSWTAQSQQISKLHPDLVIAAVPYQEKAVTEILKSGARFLGLAPKSLADIYGDIAAIAGIMNAREEGMHVIEKMRECRGSKGCVAGSADCSVVRSGRPGAAGKGHSRSKMGEHSRRQKRPRLLRPRRIP